MLSVKKFGLLLGILIILFIFFFVDLDPAKPQLKTMMVITVLMATLWITEAIPLSITSLIPLILYPLTGILGTDETATSYMNSIIFLFFGGFLIAIAMEEWDLHKRIALKIITIFGGSPVSIILGFLASGSFISMWISNTATALLLLPIGLAIISKLEHEFGLDKTRGLSVAILLSIAYSSTLGGIATLVGTPPNLVFVKTLQILFPTAPEISFGNWMLLCVPISILMLTVTGFLLTKILFKVDAEVKLNKNFINDEYKKLGSFTFEEKAVSIVFFATAMLWIFRGNLNFGFMEIPGWSSLLPYSEFVNDGTVAVTMSFILFLIPSRNQKRNILDYSALTKVPWGIILLFGGGFALAKGFTSTGLSQFIGQQLEGFSSLSPIWVVIITATIITFLTELTSNTATTQMILPILASVSVAIAINPLLLMITATLSASMAFMLPVGTPPNTIIFSSSRIKIFDMAKTGLALNLAGVIIISLLVYFLGDIIFGLSNFPEWGVIKK